MSDEIPVTLRDEQRAALAKFLGLSVLNSFPDGAARYWCTNDRRIGSDADLMLALLNRAAESGYIPALEYTTACCWWFRIWKAPSDPGAFGATPLEAVTLAVLQLPEAQ